MTRSRGVDALRQRRHDILDRGFGRHLDRRVGEPEPLGAQPHLGHGLLAGNIDGAVTAARECGRDFEQQRRFADAGIAAEQQHRAAHQAAAGDAIEFGDAGGKPRRFVCLTLERFDREQPPLARRTPRSFGAFLDQRIPLAAGFALAGPAREGRAATLADEILRACGHVPLPTPIDEMAARAETGENLIADRAGGGGDIVDGDLCADQRREVAAMNRAVGKIGDVDADQVHRNAARRSGSACRRRWPRRRGRSSVPLPARTSPSA